MAEKWWKEAVIYQIYPRSFLDSNGDGIGDLNGIISKLDYLKNLGVDALWICPVYKSPDADNGYDISDYKAIQPAFGTMKDFKRLLAETHKRGMKLIIDTVLNHTSDEHKWFIESRKSKNNRYRNYYIWRPPRNGSEPSNWSSYSGLFGGSAWEFDKRTGDYYFHIFAKKQPDLNWKNRKVRLELYDMLRWWLDKGVDGFRLDAINHIAKADGFPDAKLKNGQKYADARKYFTNGPNIHKYIHEMNHETFSNYDIMTVGETHKESLQDFKHARPYVEGNRHELSMVFHENNEILGKHGKLPRNDNLTVRYYVLKWNLIDLKENISTWQNGLYGDCWDSVYLGNHDYPRIISRFGDEGRYRTESGKMIATLLLTLRGTPYIYQGDEIGMTNAHFGRIGDYRDVVTMNYYSESVKKNGMAVADAMSMIKDASRDNARTPMQWNADKNAGFTTGKPWIGVTSNYKLINVVNSLADKDSIFYYYKKLLALRKKNKVLIYGKYKIILKEHKQIYAYTRAIGGTTALVILNFSAKVAQFRLPKSIKHAKSRLLISNYKDSSGDVERLILRPYESLVYLL